MQLHVLEQRSCGGLPWKLYPSFGLRAQTLGGAVSVQPWVLKMTHQGEKGQNAVLDRETFSIKGFVIFFWGGT